MPQIFIPSRSIRRWTGVYKGKYYGTIWKTFNVDFDRNEGSVMLSRRMERIEDTLSDFTGDNQYTTFIRTDADSTDRYWALRYGQGLSKTDSTDPENNSSPADSWDTDALTNTPTATRDMTVHGNDSRNDSGKNKLFVTLDSGDIAVLNDTGDNVWTASWWETKHSQASMDTAVLFRPIEYFPFRKITLVGDANLIHTISRPSDTQNDTLTNSRLVLPKYLNARHIFYTDNRTWICTDHKFGGEGAVVEWDGFTESYNDIHRIYGMSALSGVDYNGVPIVLNNKGTFLEFTGSGFHPMIRNGQEIALPLAQGSSLASGSDTSISVSVFPRGMTVGEDGLIYVNTAEANISSERFGAGIWCLNPLTGRLYQRHSLGRWGDSVDYGHQELNGAGGLYWVPSSVSTRNLLAGGVINIAAAGTPQTGIWLLESDTSTTITKGYFITQVIPSENVKDLWDNLWILFRQFMTSTNRIIMKARGVRSMSLTNRRPLSATITWTSTTTFTLTLAAGDDPLVVGDEVEVLDGVNAGQLAHITIITGDHAALQTITIDETMTTGSSTSTARFEKWKKLGTISNTNIYDKSMNIGIDSPFLQLKGELRGPASEMEINELIVNSEASIKIKK